MPRSDGTGPPGGGARGGGIGAGGSGMGRMGGNMPGSGPSGNCVCPSCGKTAPHERGIPCSQIQCPKCGSPMLRQ